MRLLCRDTAGNQISEDIDNFFAIIAFLVDAY
jgi:hypothetical protein